MSAASAQVSTFIHATEAPERVRRAMENICPLDLFDAKTEKRKLKGHYGNEISRLTLNIRGGSADSFFQRLWSLLPSSDRAVIIDDLDSRLDNDGKMHLRLDKQESLRANILLQNRDPIKIELVFRTKGDQRDELLERFRRLSERSPDSSKLMVKGS